MTTTCTGPQLFIKLRQAFEQATKSCMRNASDVKPELDYKIKRAADKMAFNLLNHDRTRDEKRQELHAIANDKTFFPALVKSAVIEALG